MDTQCHFKGLIYKLETKEFVIDVTLLRCI